jgi:hypothetical protein
VDSESLAEVRRRFAERTSKPSNVTDRIALSVRNLSEDDRERA